MDSLSTLSDSAVCGTSPPVPPHSHQPEQTGISNSRRFSLVVCVRSFADETTRFSLGLLLWDQRPI